MAKFWELFLFFLKKIGMSLLTIGGFLAGIFCWGLAIYPFNFPYLLHLPSEETDLVISSICGLLFVYIVTITVRTKWCYDNDLFFSKEDNRFIALVGRIVKSQEFIADVAVFALYVSVIAIAAGISVDAPWYSILTGTAAMAVGEAWIFAVLDCLLYVIARKRADRRLRKLQRKREQ